MAVLIVEKGSDRGRKIQVQPGETIVIGRDSTANLRLSDSMCSRLHFKIFHEDDFWIRDLGSRNGTVVNGRPVEEATLSFGDMISIGETVFSFAETEQKKDPLIGKNLSGYQVEDRIGRGGMGVVYRAHQMSLSRDVALKVVNRKDTDSEDEITNFINEARAAAKLNHPNVVQVYDVKTTEDDICFFSMELLPGGSVQDRVSREKTIPLEEALLMGAQAARGLSYAQAKGIVHRDIKPDNLMLTEDGTVKIGDMGLARLVSDEDDDQALVGTPHYIAPERVRGKDAGHAGDVYSLGATLYRMIGGTTPFSGGSVREIVARKLKEDPPLLSDLNPSIPADVAAYVQQLQDRDPESRPQAFTEIAEQLDALAHTAAGETLRVGAGAATPGGLPKWAVPAGAGALVLLLLIVFGMGGDPEVDPPDPEPGPEQPADPENNPPEQPEQPEQPGNPGDQTAEELGELYFQRAATFVREELDPRRPATIQEAIRKFQVVIDRAPTSSFARKAEGRIEELKRGEVDSRAGIALEQCLETYDDLFRKFEEKVARGQIDPDAFVEMKEVFVPMSVDHKGTPAASRAVTWIGCLTKVKQEVESVAREYDVARKNVLEHLDADRFKEAYRGVESIRTRIGKPKIDPAPRPELRNLAFLLPAADALMLEVRQKGMEALKEIESQVNKLVAEDNFKAATELIDTRGPALSDAGLSEDVDAIRRIVTVAIVQKAKEDAAAADAERRAQLQVEFEKIDALAISNWAAIRTYDFETAATETRKLIGQVKEEMNVERIQMRTAQLDALQKLFKRFIDAVHQEKLKDSTVKSVNPPADLGRDSTMSDAMLVYDKRGGKVGMPWTDLLPPDELAKFIRLQGWSMDAETYFQLALLYREFGYFEDANRMFDSAIQRGDGAMAQQVETYRKKMQMFLNLDALVLREIHRAELLLEADEKEEARKLLRHLRRERDETQAYRDNADLISELIKRSVKR
jgi:tetratricopeptide (TPR) repeat protein